MSEFPATVLETETALRLAMLVRHSGYDLEVTPRAGGADLSASRHGTVWATFHVDVDRRRPLFLRVGATVWGGARMEHAAEVPWDAKPDEAVSAFAKNRLELACKRGREESPDHCATCPLPGHQGS